MFPGLTAACRQQAPSTNLITLKVSDDGVPSLSDRKSFTVVVNDHVEMNPGTAVVRAGEKTSIPLPFFSSAGLASLDCALLLPADRLTNLTVEALALDRASVSLELINADCAIITFTARPGYALKGAQELTRLHFTAVPGQTSAFVPVQIGEVKCLRTSPGLAPTTLARVGRVAIIGARSMLEGRLAANGRRELILYGNPGVTIASTARPTPPIRPPGCRGNKSP